MGIEIYEVRFVISPCFFLGLPDLEIKISSNEFDLIFPGNFCPFMCSEVEILRDVLRDS